MTESQAKLRLSPQASKILKERYLLRDPETGELETPMQLLQRVGTSVAQAEETYGGEVTSTAQAFLDMLLSLHFLPNSPTLMNAGTPLGQLAACFVLPVDDSLEGIFTALEHSARIQGAGGGVGIAFSRIRPKGDSVGGRSGVAGGPVGFMHVFDAITECMKQSRTRRGANMGVLRVDHPDIEEFVAVKTDPAALNNFNLSVGLTDDFMNAVAKDGDFGLINPRTGSTERTISAKSLFNRIVENAWASGEPGAVFLDSVNRGNITPHFGAMEGTNPCGEAPLLPYESCFLGSLNLARFVRDHGLDWAELARITRLAVRFLDDVIDVNEYPLPQISEVSGATRKIGIGVMGWAETLIRLEIPYDSEEAVQAAEEVMEYITFHARVASSQLARERGPFEAFPGSLFESDPDRFSAQAKRSSTVLSGRPSPDWPAFAEQLRQHGMRNATVTTIAPTGTLSLIAGTSAGIEPVYDLAYIRRTDEGEVHVVNDLYLDTLEAVGFDRTAVVTLAEQGNLRELSGIPEQVQRLFRTAYEIAPEWHVRMVASLQRWVDNAVAKTVNLQSDATLSTVSRIFVQAHGQGCKGITIYRDGTRERQVLSRGISVSGEAAATPRAVPKGKLPAISHSVQTTLGKMHLFVREVDNKPFDVFVVLGRSGSDVTAFTEAIGRLLSIGIRCGIPIGTLAENLKNLGGRLTLGFGPQKTRSVPDAIARLLEADYGNVASSVALARGDLCPSCGDAKLRYSEGCNTCASCGYSDC